MKRIIFCDNHMWALLHFRGNVIRRFINDGFDVIIVTPKADREIDNYIEGPRYYEVDMDRTSKSIYDNFNYLKSLFKIYKDTRPDVAIHYTIKPIIFGSFVSKLLGIKSVVFFAGLNNMFTSKSFTGFMSRLLLRKLIKSCKRAIFLNDHDLNFILSKKILPKPKAILLSGGEGVDLNKYSPSPNIVKPGRQVLFIARILRTKGYYEFIDVANRFKAIDPTVKFIICGDLDNGRKDAITLSQIIADEKRGNISYLGTVSVNRVISLMRESMCYVLPSYYNEGMNRSLMEALAIGIPIITCDNRGCRELVKDGITGYVIPPEDTDALEQALIRIYNLTDSERRKMSEAAREYAKERFDDRKVYDKYITILKEI